MHLGSEPGTGISVAWSSATMFQPNSSAARAGKAASRSRVTVNSPLTMSSGREVVGLDERAQQLVGGGQDLGRVVAAHGRGAADALESGRGGRHGT